jgi:hypothetical protein
MVSDQMMAAIRPMLFVLSVPAVPLYLEERAVFIREYVGRVRYVCFRVTHIFYT